jgi:hypothetical protein
MAIRSRTSAAQERANCQLQRAWRRMVVGVQSMMPFSVRGCNKSGIFRTDIYILVVLFFVEIIFCKFLEQNGVLGVVE